MDIQEMSDRYQASLRNNLIEDQTIAVKERDILYISQIFKSISHPMRLRILCLIMEKAQSVGAIFSALGTTQGNISQHLNILRNRGLISSTKKANTVIYQVSDTRILNLVALMEDVFCEMSPYAFYQNSH